MECYVLVQADVPVVIWACAQQKYSQWVSWSKIECFSSSSKPVYRFSISDRSLEFIDMEMFIFRRCISTNIHLWNCVRIDPINFRAALLNIGYLLFSNEVRMSFYKLFIRVITASWAPRRPDSSKIYIPRSDRDCWVSNGFECGCSRTVELRVLVRYCRFENEVYEVKNDFTTRLHVGSIL